jgi:hypothetical protein
LVKYRRILKYSQKNVLRMKRNGTEYEMRTLPESVTHQIDKMKGTYKGNRLELQYQEIIEELDLFIRHYKKDQSYKKS